jgi:hypothetical protein
MKNGRRIRSQYQIKVGLAMKRLEISWRNPSRWLRPFGILEEGDFMNGSPFLNHSIESILVDWGLGRTSAIGPQAIFWNQSLVRPQRINREWLHDLASLGFRWYFRRHEIGPCFASLVSIPPLPQIPNSDKIVPQSSWFSYLVVQDGITIGAAKADEDRQEAETPEWFRFSW